MSTQLTDAEIECVRDAQCREAVQRCADEQECPDCWEAFYEGAAMGADRRTRPELRAEIESVAARLRVVMAEYHALEVLVETLRPLAESDPCWTVDSVCGYCEGRAGDGPTYHKPDCEWLKAHAALQERLS